MDKSSKYKINKEIQVLNDTLGLLELTDNFRTFHPNAEYTFFSSVHRTFSRIEHILGHKSNLSKLKKIEIVSSIISDHNAKRIDISYKRKSRDITLPTKVHLVKAMVFPVVMYGCES